MEADRFRQLEELYHAALKIDRGQRAEYLREHCNEDQSLYSALESLLQQPVSVDSVFDHPAFADAAKLLAGESEPGNGPGKRAGT